MSVYSFGIVQKGKVSSSYIEIKVDDASPQDSIFFVSLEGQLCFALSALVVFVFISTRTGKKKKTKVGLPRTALWRPDTDEGWTNERAKRKGVMSHEFLLQSRCSTKNRNNLRDMLLPPTKSV